MNSQTSLRAAAATLGAFALVAAMATPAQAIGDSGKFNMWQHDAYQGQHESRYSYDNDLHNDACSGCDPGPGGNFGDDMSSFVNNTDNWWYLYTDRTSYSTQNNQLFCVRPRSKDGDLGNNGYTNLEDEISSLQKGSVGRFSDPSPTDNITCKRIIGHKI